MLESHAPLSPLAGRRRSSGETAEATRLQPSMDLDTPAKRLQWARRNHLRGRYATPTEAARAFGWPVSTYLGHENGDRNPSRMAAKRYAKAYRVRWEWLLENEGTPTQGAEAPIVGEVSAGAVVKRFLNTEKCDTTELPPGGTSATVALVVRGGSMRGIADSGWLFFFDEERRPPTKDLIGRLCVVEVDGGAVCIRTLQPGHRRGRFDLESATEPTLRDVRVVWAAPITWIKPR